MSSEAALVLIVDDDEVIRRLMRVNLELEDFDVVEAIDGQACLDSVRARRPVVVVLDAAMPEVDGLTVTAQLRADPATSALGIVMVSARAQRADIRRGLEAGADAYLTKPFDPEVFVRTVRQLAGRGHAGRPDAEGSASARDSA